jgi:hypothetical protein
MARPQNTAVEEAVRDLSGVEAGEARSGISTQTSIDEDFSIVVEIAKGTGPFGVAELDVYERYMAHILDVVLGK